MDNLPKYHKETDYDCMRLYPASSDLELGGGPTKEPRNSNIARRDTKLLYEGDLQFVGFLDSKKGRKKSIEHALDTNKLYRLEIC